MGWEQVLDYSRGVYYVNHMDSESNPPHLLLLPLHPPSTNLSSSSYSSSTNLCSSSSSPSPEQVQSEDPRLEWRALQEDMLRQYLVTAQEDLQAKKDLVTVKQQRLSLAQDEWQHLNTTLGHFSNSTTSCKSYRPTSHLTPHIPYTSHLAIFFPSPHLYLPPLYLLSNRRWCTFLSPPLPLGPPPLCTPPTSRTLRLLLLLPPPPGPLHLLLLLPPFPLQPKL